MFFNKVFAFFAAIITAVSLLIAPAESVQGIFPEDEKTAEKIYFDEGEFSPSADDIFVSPDGDDENEGTMASPVATLKGAKELAKAKSAENITVWFMGGTYSFSEKVTFNSSDRSGVTYRSIPGEEVVFTGSYEISNWEKKKLIE